MSEQGFRFQRSVRLQERGRRLIPGGCHTYAKGEDQYPVLAPGFIERGLGCHVWDVDGNEYIEYGMGNRSVGLGHAYPSVLRAAEKAIRGGCNFTRPARIEVDCAETFLELIGAQMVKFCKDGSDATSGAVRLARAYTGRDLVACCADHPFFSTDDWFIGTTPMNAGIPEAVRNLTVTFRYNDVASVKELFDRYPGRLAALIMEPSRGDDPTDGFLHKVQRLCRDNGALLILDEMITGFRWHAGGAQKLYGIEPDLSTFGKALGNGFSVSALAGKREYMRLGGLEHTDRPRVFLLSTTHGAETHALAAAIATMRVYQNEPVIEHLYNQGTKLRDGIEEAARRHGVDRHFKVVGRPCCLAFATLDLDGKPSQAYRSLFLQETIRRGVLMPSLVVSYTHDNAAVMKTIEAVDGALAVYAQALESGASRFLVGRPSQVVFRRYNSGDERAEVSAAQETPQAAIIGTKGQSASQLIATS
ncbi:glutamate-1-semialdehyde 2,1-aminomutase [Mesorhizobium sp. M3A.F.Ca.ET.174.01.1.1]|uniref:glutamate-1-semialdehyde 2,1-aminomutase n=1 Tax=unclassified Mesorhizobium TaxID=325217 RepID=UPI001093E6E2|nr:MULTISPECIES: glutamate-1-semialdehyde 2,1-aminomutase [unclassified Mesorhizobium]TGS82668.1 glutamate-1-semialdehyde 2,1-aminomutase [Mesorhizobium sp. M3A.F.Ca.ET.175.01.1.1]TGT22613.1 glutamate-1-semialdehyde 2,1-aminomutase [Mesorhizobium sp. M3A.F.Ca.ET.174.01.1.1]